MFNTKTHQHVELYDPHCQAKSGDVWLRVNIRVQHQDPLAPMVKSKEALFVTSQGLAIALLYPFGFHT